MPSKRPSTPPAAAIDALAPVIKPLVEPLVEPVLTRLDRHEQLLLEMKTALDVQFKRTAQIQAQLDQVVAGLSKTRT